MDLSCDSDSDDTIIEEVNIKQDSDLEYDPSKVKDEPANDEYDLNDSNVENSSSFGSSTSERFPESQIFSSVKSESIDCPSCQRSFEAADIVASSSLCVKCDFEHASASPVSGKVVPVSFSTSDLGNSFNDIPERSNDETWICLLCDKRFKSYGNFTRHLLLHSTQCGQCNKHFEDEAGLKKHLEEDHAFKCEVCGKVFQKRVKLEYHKVTHSDARPYPCEFCELKFKQKSHMKGHMRSFHGHLLSGGTKISVSSKGDNRSASFADQSISSDAMGDSATLASDDLDLIPNCLVCGTAFTNQTVYKRHMYLHPTKCGVCGEDVENQQAIKVHLKKVHFEPLKCPLCNKQFIRPNKLEMHINSHAGLRPFECEYCGKKFKQKPHLRGHITSFHSQKKNEKKTGRKKIEANDAKFNAKLLDKELSRCAVCGTTFEDFSVFKRHLYFHPRQCGICLAEFETEEEIKFHIKDFHNDPRKLFHCDICNRAFRQRNKLEIHVNSHSNLRPYACELCDKKFKQKSHLNGHVRRMHTEVDKQVDLSSFTIDEEVEAESSFVCLVCHVNYSSRMYFKRHLYFHTKCGICGLENDTLDRMKVHLKLKHARDWQCFDCKKWFNCLSKLKRHKLIHLKAGKRKYERTMSSNWARKDLSMQSDLALVRQDLERYTCKACEEVLLSFDSYKCHLVVHENSCGVCGCELSGKDEFRQHMRKHVQFYECELCDEYFPFYNELLKHKSSQGANHNARNKERNSNLNHVRIRLDSSADIENAHQVSANQDPSYNGNMKISASFSCARCYRGVSSKNALMRHLLRHMGSATKSAAFGICLDILSSCQICHFKVETTDDLERHYHEGHAQSVPKPEAKCPECRAKMNNTEDFYAHLTKHYKINTWFTCVSCQARFSSQTKLENHRKSHCCQRQKFHCLKCRRHFPGLRALKYHRYYHQSERAYRCHVCKQVYSHQNKLSRHIKETHYKSDHFYTCSVCHKTFDKKYEFENHVTIHTKLIGGRDGAIGHKCETCGKKCSSIWTLQLHRRRNHRDRPYECGICGKSYIRQSQYNKHIRLHSVGPDKPFTCDKCGRSYSSKVSFENHMGKHLDELPSTCKICDKKFVSDKELQYHMKRTHVPQEKKYQCHLCNHRTNLKGNLNMHMKTHSEERPHKCKQCGKSFKAMSNLRIHENGHLEVKPYPCSHCSSTFGTQNYLWAHQLRVHGIEKPFKCEVCERSYATEYQLKTHLLLHKQSSLETGDASFTVAAATKLQPLEQQKLDFSSFN